MGQSKISVLLSAAMILSGRCALAQTALERLETGLRSGANVAEPAYLGATADDHGEQGAGVRLVDVKTGSPAQLSGLLKNDLITAVAGVRIHSLDEFAAQLAKVSPDAKVRFDVLRGAEKRSIDVTLGGRAATRPAPLGIRVVTVDEEARVSHGLKTAQGALVTSVTEGSTAQRAGLPLDAVIVAVDQQRINTADDAVRSLRQATVGQTLKLSFYYRGDLIERPVTIEAATAVVATPPAVVQKPAAKPPAAGKPGTNAGPKPFSSGPMVNDRSAEVEELEKRLSTLEQRLETLEATLRKFYEDAGVTPAETPKQ